MTAVVDVPRIRKVYKVGRRTFTDRKEANVHRLWLTRLQRHDELYQFFLDVIGYDNTADGRGAASDHVFAMLDKFDVKPKKVKKEDPKC